MPEEKATVEEEKKPEEEAKTAATPKLSTGGVILFAVALVGEVLIVIYIVSGWGSTVLDGGSSDSDTPEAVEVDLGQLSGSVGAPPPAKYNFKIVLQVNPALEDPLEGQAVLERNRNRVLEIVQDVLRRQSKRIITDPAVVDRAAVQIRTALNFAYPLDIRGRGIVSGVSVTKEG